jgi:hypothetical protein
MTNNREIRHCEQPRRSLSVGGLRGNPQKWLFLKKYLKLKALPCLWIALSLRVHSNDFYAVYEVDKCS